jgi:16S rRNA processing protein RimM
VAAPQETDTKQDWVRVARLGRTRGLRGELHARACHGADRYKSLRRVWLRRPDGLWAGEGEPFRVEWIRPYKDGLIYKFRGIDQVAAAEALRQCEVLIPKEERPLPGEGEVYLADLLGCEVICRASGHRIGFVAGWQEFGGPELLEVEPEGKPGGALLWIPLVRAICAEIDLAGKRILIDPPEGLLELNDASGAA